MVEEAAELAEFGDGDEACWRMSVSVLLISGWSLFAFSLTASTFLGRSCFVSVCRFLSATLYSPNLYPQPPAVDG